MPEFTPARRARVWRELGGATLLILAAIVAIRGLGAAPVYTLEHHWLAMAPTAGLVGILAIGAVVLTGRRWRNLAVGVAAGLWALLVFGRPVCLLIEPTERPNFETVLSLQDRAARGEPFNRFGNDWYQCKRYIARGLSF